MPKIFATVRVKSRILSRVIYSASQQGGGVALQDGSGTTFNVDKIDLGGVQDTNVTIRKDNQRTFQILPPSAGGDGEHQQLILSNSENFVQYFKSGEINVTLGMEKTGLGVLNVGGMYLIAQDGTATNVAGISILKNGSIAVGDNLGADRFTKMYYRHDNHAKWALLPQGEQDRIIPDIEWVLANSGSSEYLELGTFVPLMPFSTNGDYTNYTLTGDITINATGITFGKFRAVYITQSAGQTYKIDLGSNITQVFGVDPLDAGEFTLLPGSYMFYFASVRSGPSQGVHLNVPEGQEVTQTPPTIVSFTMAADNTYGDLLGSEPLWGDIGASLPVLLADLNVVFAANGGTATDWIESSVKQNDAATEGAASALVGGETTLRIFGAISGTPDGQETVTVGPTDGASIFDGAGNAMNASQTGVDNLQAGASIILVSDNFNDNSIDAGKWNTDSIANATIIETNQELQLNCSAGSSGEFGLETLNSYSSVNDILIIQAKTVFTDDLEINALFRVSASPWDANNNLTITRIGVTRDKFRIIVKDEGVNEINENTSIDCTIAQDVRMLYNSSTGAASFEYWNGSAWASLGTAGNLDLGTSIIVRLYASASGLGNVNIYDDFFVSDNNYSTRYPT